MKMFLITTLRGSGLSGCKALAAAAMMLLPLSAGAQADEFQRWWQRTDQESLPLVNLSVDMQKLNTYTYTQATVTIADHRQRTQAGRDMVSYDCQVKYRGMISKRYPKKSLAMKLVDAGGEKLDAPLFGLRNENNWILDGMYKDRLRMKNRVCFDVWNAMSGTPYETNFHGRNGTVGLFVNLFFNGRYQGLYCLSDKVDRKLLGLKKYRSGDDGTSTVRGLLYKGYSNGLGHDLMHYDPQADMRKDIWNAWELQYPDEIPSADTWQPLCELMDFCSEDTPDASFTEHYREYFYPDNLADYVVFMLTLNVLDNLWKNMFLSTPDIGQGHRWLVTPWDMDGSLGAWFDGEYHPWRASFHRMDSIAPFDRLAVRGLDGFHGRLVQSWNRCKDSVLHPDSIFQRLDSYAQSFMRDSTWERETALWGSDPAAFLMKPLEEELAYTKEWYRKNYNFVSGLMTTLGIGDTPAGDGKSGRQPQGQSRFVLRIDGRPALRLSGPGIYIDNGKKRLHRTPCYE